MFKCAGVLVRSSANRVMQGSAEKNRETLSAIEDDLFKLALTYRACGGARGEFVESAPRKQLVHTLRSRMCPRAQVRNAP